MAKHQLHIARVALLLVAVIGFAMLANRGCQIAPLSSGNASRSTSDDKIPTGHENPHERERLVQILEASQQSPVDAAAQVADPWGTLLKVDQDDSGRMTTSAGPDKTFGTPDDRRSFSEAQ